VEVTFITFFPIFSASTCGGGKGEWQTLLDDCFAIYDEYQDSALRFAHDEKSSIAHKQHFASANL
jgi:hypothetical protein